MASATQSVGTEVSGIPFTIESRLPKNGPLGKWIPRSFGIWSTTITTPIPALKPVNTGSEMKFATNPSRSAAASTRRTPTISTSVADARCSATASPSGTRRLNWAPMRMASVVLVLTLSGREDPVRA